MRAQLPTRRLLLCKQPLPPHTRLSLSPSPLPPPADAATQLVDRYGPNCPERCAARDFQFEALHRLLLPPHTKFLLWLAHQGEVPAGGAGGGGSEGSGSGSGSGSGAGGIPAAPPSPPAASGPQAVPLWALLTAELGLTAEVMERLRAQLRRVLGGHDMPLETWRLGAAAAYMQRLRAVVNLSAARAQSQLEAVRGILTPAQLIKYLAWAQRNSGAVLGALEPL